MLAAVRTRFGEAAPRFVLRPYVAPRHPWLLRARNWIGISALVLVGLIYGALTAIFPVFMYTYLLAPILVVVLLVIWALPSTDSYPARGMSFCFWGFFVALLVWPNYLAIDIPGLPWITVQRLFLAPLAFLLLISLSISPGFRRTLADTLRPTIWLWRLVVIFAGIQIVTFTFSPHLSDTFNRMVSSQMLWTMTFFVSAYIFAVRGRAETFLWAMIAIILLMAIIGIFEARNEAVLWAGKIPSFLAVADESVQRTLAGTMRAGTTKYRVQGVYVTSLNMAEMMGCGTALVLHAIVIARRLAIKLFLIAYIPVHFIVIQSTDSRLGMIAFFGSMLLYPLLWAMRRWKQEPNSVFGPAITLAYPAVLAVFLATSIFWYRLKVMIWGGGQNQASTEARKAQWEMFWPKIAQWPIGRGSGTSAETLGYANGEGTLTIDGYYITVGLDYGVIGFFVFFAIFFVATYYAVRMAITNNDPRRSMLIPASIIMVLFVIIKSVLSQENEHAWFFMLVGMIAALCGPMRDKLQPLPSVK